MLYAAPLGLIGAVVGLLFMLALQRLRQLLQPMKGHVVLFPLVLVQKETAAVIAVAVVVGALLTALVALRAARRAAAEAQPVSPDATA